MFLLLCILHIERVSIVNFEHVIADWDHEGSVLVLVYRNILLYIRSNVFSPFLECLKKVYESYTVIYNIGN